jgi:hypothetical protein
VAIRVFIDIAGPEGGRLYILDEEGRLLRTSDFSMDENEGFSFDEPISEDVEASYLSIPLDYFDFRLLELDIAEADAAREILPFELDGLLMEPPSAYVIDAMVAVPPAQEDTNGQTAGPGRVLAVYMTKQRLRTLLDGLLEAGLDPRAVTSLELSSISAKLTEGDVSGLSDTPSGLEEPARVDLARAELDGPCINMRRGEFAFKGDVREGLRSMAFTASLFVAFMLVLTVVFSLKAIHSGNSADLLEEHVLGIYGEIFPGKKPASARGLSYKVRSKLKELKDKAGSMRSVEALDMLMALQGALPDGGEVRFLDITLDLNAVLLKGEGKDLESIERARAAMESFLSEVKITETGKAVSGQTGFTISARTEPDGSGEQR